MEADLRRLQRISEEWEASSQPSLSMAIPKVTQAADRLVQDADPYKTEEVYAICGIGSNSNSDAEEYAESGKGSSKRVARKKTSNFRPPPLVRNCPHQGEP